MEQWLALLSHSKWVLGLMPDYLCRVCMFTLCLHAQLSWATVIPPLRHLIGLLSLSQHTCAGGESIYCPTLLQ